MIQNRFIFKQEYRIFKAETFSRYLNFFVIFGTFFENFRRDIWTILCVFLERPTNRILFTLAFYINLSIKTQARVEHAETSFKAGKYLRPASCHFTRHQFYTCGRSLFDWLRNSTEGGREKTLGTMLMQKFSCGRVVC